MTRNVPEIKHTETKGYLNLLANNYDTVKETFNVIIPEHLADRMEERRLEAEEAELGKGEGLSFQLGNEDLQMSALRGRGGQKWMLFNDDIRISIRSPKMEWCLSVEYSAAGLWEHGIHALRKRAIDMLYDAGMHIPAKEGADDKEWQRLSIVHFAFDYYSERFSEEMRPEITRAVLCHSAVKKRVQGAMEQFDLWAVIDKVETLTIGSKKSVQIQIYNKGKEITEVSGKTWMYKIWEEAGYYPPEEGTPKHVWRLEIRLGKEFLKNRGILTFEEFEEKAAELLTEALLSRRLTRPTADTNRARWPLHEIWTAAYKQLGQPLNYVPLGKQQTETKTAIKERLQRTCAGVLRTMTVLECGYYDNNAMMRNVIASQDILRIDKQHDKKVNLIQERYRYGNEAR